jgi:CheR methyltransferase, all-alpha domain
MTAAPETDASVDALLDFLKRSRGIDFTGYKRTSLERRFRRRLDAVGRPSFGDYLDYLEADADEFDAPAAPPVRRRIRSRSASPRCWGSTPTATA